MKLILLLLSLSVFCPCVVLGQNSINELDIEKHYDSDELIRFMRKPLNESLRLVSTDAHYGIIDSNGRVIVPTIYDQIKIDFSKRENLLLLEIYTSENEDFYFFWENGFESQELYDQWREQELQKPRSPLNLETKFREAPFFAAQKETKWGVINAHNEILIPFEYNSIEEIGEDLLLVRKDKESSILSPSNEVIVPPCDTIIQSNMNDRHLPFGNRFAVFVQLVKDNRYGAINTFTRKFALPKYDSLEICYSLPEDACPCAFDVRDICLNCNEGQRKRNHFYRNIVRYKSGNKTGLFNMISMEELTPASYDLIRLNGYWKGQIVQLDSLYTFMIDDNTRLHPDRFDSVSSFIRARFFKVQANGKTGVYSHLGKLILPIKWEDITDACYSSNSNYFIVKRRGKYGLVDHQGKFRIRPKYDEITQQVDRTLNKRYLQLKRNGETEEILIRDL